MYWPETTARHMVWCENILAARSSRESPMKANLDHIRSQVRNRSCSLLQKLYHALISRRPLSISAVLIVLSAGQAALAQGTVFIGGQGETGVTINLSAIYGGPGGSYVAPIPSLQPNLAGSLGLRKLQIPNLHLLPPSRRVTLRQPGRAPARSASRPAPAASARAKAPKVAALPRPPVRAKALPAAKLPPAKLPMAKGPGTASPKVIRKSPARSLAPPAPPAPPAAPASAAPAKQAPAKIARLAPPPPRVMATKKAPPPAAKAPLSKAPMPKAPKTKAALPKAPSLKVTAPKAPMAKTLAPPPPPPAIMRKAEKAAKTTAAPPPAPAPPAVGRTAPVVEKRQRLAALTPSGDKLVRVRFRAGSSVLTRDDEDRLKAMADKVAPTQARLQLKAYAESSGNDTSKARRLSLSRALAVRSFLIENGLRSTRIDVRALGIARDGGAPDRVDIVLLGQ